MRERNEEGRGHRGANRGWLKRERDSKQRETPLVPETLPPVSNSLSPSIFLSILPPAALTPLALHLPPFFLDFSLCPHPPSFTISIPLSLSQFLFLLTLATYSSPLWLSTALPRTTPAVDASRVVATGSERSNVPGTLRVSLHVCQQVCYAWSIMHFAARMETHTGVCCFQGR